MKIILLSFNILKKGSSFFFIKGRIWIRHLWRVGFGQIQPGSKPLTGTKISVDMFLLVIKFFKTKVRLYNH